MRKNKTAVVLVTYNRLDLLKGSLEAVLNQSDPIKHLFVIDNDSTDGTSKFLKDFASKKNNVTVKSLQRNIGGAGGFNEGIKLAYNSGSFDSYWLMDDDTFPKMDAHENLMNAVDVLDGEYGFLSSNVLWTDGLPAVMNVPTVDKIWNERVSDDIVGLKSGSFVSMLVSNEAVKKIGLPIKEFFIWGDDVEYSSRISRNLQSFFVINSKVIHKTKTNNGINIFDEGKDRVGRYYYDVRNSMYRHKKEGFKSALKYGLGQLSLAIKLLFKKTNNRFTKSFTVFKGLIAGLFFNPSIEYV